ncbi:hypothetical protein D3C76_1501780 [compost metagenome]
MPGNNGHTEHNQPAALEVQQPGQHDHADANAPDHLQPEGLGRKLGVPGETHEGDFQKHQEQTALEQEHRGFTGRMFLAIEPGRQAGEEDKRRGANLAEHSGEIQVRRHA